MDTENIERIGETGIAPHESCTHIGKSFGRPLHKCRHLGIDLRVAQRQTDCDAQTGHAAIEPNAEIAPLVWKTEPVPIVRLRHHRQHPRRRLDRGRHWTEMCNGPEHAQRIGGHDAEGWFQPNTPENPAGIKSSRRHPSRYANSPCQAPPQPRRRRSIRLRSCPCSRDRGLFRRAEKSTRPSNRIRASSSCRAERRHSRATARPRARFTPVLRGVGGCAASQRWPTS